jgi:predicted transcriptional regulator
VKKSKASKSARKALTPAELEMMNVIWRIGPCTIAQVVEELRPRRELAYTSVSTVVRIMEQKGYVKSVKEGRGHRYEAAVSKAAYQATSLQSLLSNVFDGEPSLLVQRLLDSKAITSAELEQIRALLREKA